VIIEVFNFSNRFNGLSRAQKTVETVKA